MRDRRCVPSASPHFTKVFTMVGITKYAHLFPNQTEALAAL